MREVEGLRQTRKLCLLFTGYEGENCQLDIDECSERPCENDGKCFQRSDIQNYETVPEFSQSQFSFEDAAGFICRCPPGFTGESRGLRKCFVSKK